MRSENQCADKAHWTDDVDTASICRRGQRHGTRTSSAHSMHGFELRTVGTRHPIEGKAALPPSESRAGATERFWGGGEQGGRCNIDLPRTHPPQTNASGHHSTHNLTHIRRNSPLPFTEQVACVLLATRRPGTKGEAGFHSHPPHPFPSGALAGCMCAAQTDTNTHSGAR